MNRSCAHVHTTALTVVAMPTSTAASRTMGAECMVPLPSPPAPSCEHMQKLDGNSLKLDGDATTTSPEQVNFHESQQLTLSPLESIPPR